MKKFILLLQGTKDEFELINFRVFHCLERCLGSETVMMLDEVHVFICFYLFLFVFICFYLYLFLFVFICFCLFLFVFIWMCMHGHECMCAVSGRDWFGREATGQCQITS